MLKKIFKEHKKLLLFLILLLASIALYKNIINAQSGSLAETNFLSVSENISNASQNCKTYFYDKTFTFKITNLNTTPTATFNGYGDDVICVVVNGSIVRGPSNCTSIGFSCPSSLPQDSIDSEAQTVDFRNKLKVGDNTIRVIVHNKTTGASVKYSLYVGTSPWLSVRGATISTGGYTNFSIPNRTYDLPNETNVPTYLAEELAISGSSLPSSRSSQNNKTLSNYNNLANKFVSNGNWYEYLLAKAKANETFPFAESNVTSISNKISTSMGVVPGSFNVWYFNNLSTSESKLTISADTVCDVKGVFFIEGSLTLNPSFKNADYNSGCLFIASKNINITTNTSSNSTCNSNLDILVLVDGTASMYENNYESQLEQGLDTFVNKIDLGIHRVAIMDQTGWASNFGSVEQFIFDNSQKPGLKVRLKEYIPNSTNAEVCDAASTSSRCKNRNIVQSVKDLFDKNPRNAKKIIIKIDNGDGYQIGKDAADPYPNLGSCNGNTVDSAYTDWQSLKSLADIYYLQLTTGDSCGNTRCFGRQTNSVDYVESLASSSANHSIYCPAEVTSTAISDKLQKIVDSNCGFGYENVEGFFIAKDTLSTNQVSGDSKKGIFILGGVFAGSLNLKRDLQSQNRFGPSHTISYDPRYKVMFNDLFSSLDYSLRENLN